MGAALTAAPEMETASGMEPALEISTIEFCRGSRVEAVVDEDHRAWAMWIWFLSRL